MRNLVKLFLMVVVVATTGALTSCNESDAKTNVLTSELQNVSVELLGNGQPVYRDADGFVYVLVHIQKGDSSAKALAYNAQQNKLKNPDISSKIIDGNLVIACNNIGGNPLFDYTGSTKAIPEKYFCIMFKTEQVVALK